MNERHGERPDTPETEPAPTITSKARTARWYDRRQGNTKQGGHRQMVRLIPDSDPAPTIGSAGLSTGRDVWVYRNGNQEREADPLGLKGDDWPESRPATTVAGDQRIFQLGGHHQPGEQSLNAVRVTPQEAATLQGFPADYPFQGSRTKVFEQIGNAIPPPFARAIIEALLG